MGAADGMCAPAYDLYVHASLSSADGALSESFDTIVRVPTSNSASFSAQIALDDVGGSVEPVAIVPSEWDAVALSVDASIQAPADASPDTAAPPEDAPASQWVGSAMFQASRDTSDEDSFDTATGTGTVGVSGMSEMVGSFALDRE